MFGKIARWLDSVVREDARLGSSGRYAPRMLRFRILLFAGLVAALLLAWILFVNLARLSGEHIGWLLSGGKLTSAKVYNLAQATATLVALTAGVFALLYAYRKQRIDEAAGHRADAAAFLQRYQAAAQHLGHDKAAVRTAGVYAMVHLADDWAERRQMCVDVLCAYLRSPVVTGEPREGADLSDYSVRRTIGNNISAHLQPGLGRDSWSALSFDLRGGTLVDFQLQDNIFHSKPDFREATFEGLCAFHRVTFECGASFQGCSVMGTLEVTETRLTPTQELRFDGTLVQAHASLVVSFAEVDVSNTVTLDRMKTHGNCCLLVSPGDAQGVTISLREGVLAASGRVAIKRDAVAAGDTRANIQRVDLDGNRTAVDPRFDIDTTLIEDGIVCVREEH
jgi:hypothetical protein